MAFIKTGIIPSQQIFVGKKETLDKRAICVFAGTGFFLEDDTYFNELKVLQPGRTYTLHTETKAIVADSPYFKWHYSPVERPLKQIVEEFADLFETILKEQIGERSVILPLSGGLDSRTLAAALHHLGIKTRAFSYAFKGGHDEIAYGEKVAKRCSFPFESYVVGEGYLWNSIDRLAAINKCYSEFTHPRQMAFIDAYAKLGEVFCLGHWGDVLFDNMGVADTLSLDGQVRLLLKKIVKKGGLELAESLWDFWGLEGDFQSYLKTRVRALLLDIDIKQNANAQMRAFKSLYWAPRWTSVNLSVFEEVRPLALPYYDNRMCEFICTVPECYLSGRQIQIEYLKLRMPAIAKLVWQDHRPFNLYTYHYNRFPYNLPYRIAHKLKRSLQQQPYIQRNWELQFLGGANDEYLKARLFDNDTLSQGIPKPIVEEFYNLFKTKNPVYYSHPLSMLLTLSLFFKSLNT